MPDIRYVCLSDMHLGDEGSLLTRLKEASSDADPTRPSEVLERLVECLRLLISKNESKEKPTLVLNGDILELALATDNQAAMVFERFIELIHKDGEPLFQNIVYVPGNHDHHVWESARETQYVDHLGKIPLDHPLPAAWHTTNIFAKPSDVPVVPRLLSRLVARRAPGRRSAITVAYPSYGVVSKDGRKCVLFHHGHYIESLYSIVSKLKTYVFPGTGMPTSIWDLEQENFAWIDFFWSVMGRQGDAGKGIGIVYKRLQHERWRRVMTEHLADGIAKDDTIDAPGYGNWTESKILRFALRLLVGWASRQERGRADAALADETHKGLDALMSGPLREQLLGELHGTMPTDVTLVFGHTHKPFEQDMKFNGYPEWVDVYNTGGWVVEAVEPSPCHGGAVVLVDEHLDATSLRMYTESRHDDAYCVKVHQSLHPEKPPHAFHKRIEGLVDPEAVPWRGFSRAAARAVRERETHLFDMLRSVGDDHPGIKG